MKAIIRWEDIIIKVPLSHALGLNRGDIIMTDEEDENGNLLELYVEYKWYCISKKYGKPQLVICCTIEHFLKL